MQYSMKCAAVGLVALLGGSFVAPSTMAAEQGAPTCLPIEAGDDGTPIIRANINGAGPFAFVPDTAASGTTIDPARAAPLAPPSAPATDQAHGLAGANPPQP